MPVNFPSPARQGVKASVQDTHDSVVFTFTGDVSPTPPFTPQLYGGDPYDTTYPASNAPPGAPASYPTTESSLLAQFKSSLPEWANKSEWLPNGGSGVNWQDLEAFLSFGGESLTDAASALGWSTFVELLSGMMSQGVNVYKTGDKITGGEVPPLLVWEDENETVPYQHAASPPIKEDDKVAFLSIWDNINNLATKSSTLNSPEMGTLIGQMYALASDHTGLNIGATIQESDLSSLYIPKNVLPVDTAKEMKSSAIDQADSSYAYLQLSDLTGDAFGTSLSAIPLQIRFTRNQPLEQSAVPHAATYDADPVNCIQNPKTGSCYQVGEQIYGSANNPTYISEIRLLPEPSILSLVAFTSYAFVADGSGNKTVMQVVSSGMTLSGCPDEITARWVRPAQSDGTYKIEIKRIKASKSPLTQQLPRKLTDNIDTSWFHVRENIKLEQYTWDHDTTGGTAGYQISIYSQSNKEVLIGNGTVMLNEQCQPPKALCEPIYVNFNNLGPFDGVSINTVDATNTDSVAPTMVTDSGASSTQTGLYEYSGAWADVADSQNEIFEPACDDCLITNNGSVDTWESIAESGDTISMEFVRFLKPWAPPGKRLEKWLVTICKGSVCANAIGIKQESQSLMEISARQFSELISSEDSTPAASYLTDGSVVIRFKCPGKVAMGTKPTADAPGFSVKSWTRSEGGPVDMTIGEPEIDSSTIDIPVQRFSLHSTYNNVEEQQQIFNNSLGLDAGELGTWTSGEVKVKYKISASNTATYGADYKILNSDFDETTETGILTFKDGVAALKSNSVMDALQQTIQVEILSDAILEANEVAFIELDHSYVETGGIDIDLPDTAKIVIEGPGTTTTTSTSTSTSTTSTSTSTTSTTTTSTSTSTTSTSTSTTSTTTTSTSTSTTSTSTSTTSTTTTSTSTSTTSTTTTPGPGGGGGCECGDTAVFEAYACTGPDTESSTPTYVCGDPAGNVEAEILIGNYYFKGFYFPDCTTCGCFKITNTTDMSVTETPVAVVSPDSAITQCDTPGNGGCPPCA